MKNINRKDWISLLVIVPEDSNVIVTLKLIYFKI